MLYGVDVSFWKDFPDWRRAKEAGIEFAIFGVTELNGIDSSFEHNYKGCTDNGIIKGAYKYSYAHNAAESRKEAQDVVAALKGRPLDLPLFLDLEWEWQERNLSQGAIWQIIQAFKDVVEQAGYRFGIYCNLNWYWNVLPAEARAYDFWIACPSVNDIGTYNSSLRPNIPNMLCWQYSFNGFVPGIGDQIDLDAWYGEVPAVSASETPTGPHEEARPMLSYGSTGNAVLEAQRLLNARGAHLVEDGIFGTNTRAAVYEYQRQNGLEADGIIGPITWASLRAQKSPYDIADEVLRGMWGNGEERRRRLTEAGYDYDTVQGIVNKLA